MARAADGYGSEGSVPTVAPTGLNAPNISTNASPNDFGAQVGQGISKVGEEAQGLAKQYGDMVNETLMTNADADLSKVVGKIKGDYLQKTGLAAVAAFPQYQADLDAARLQFRASLPMGAAHGFDMLATRSIAAHIADGSTYAATQAKQARIDSGTNLANANVQAILDPDIASNPERVQWHQDSAIHGLQTTMDENHPGLKTDPDTGEVSFDESKPEGQQLKAQYKAGVDNIITQAQTNRFQTLAKGDVLGAFNIYQKERDTLPRPAQVQLDSMFKPMVFNAHVQNGSSAVITQANQDHAQLLYNPDSSKGAIDTVLKNEGGLSPDGHAIYGIDKDAHPKEFAEASKLSPEDGEAYARNFYKQEYWDKKGIGDLPPETQKIVMDGIVNHYPEFGDKLIAAAKNGASPQDLIDMRRTEYQRLNDTGKPEYTSAFEGWNNRLDSLQGGGKPASYATNSDGSMMTTADYYRTHSEDVLQKADALSEQQMPGDLQYKKAMRETVSNYMTKVMNNQTAQYTMDNRNVTKAINGEFTKGVPPETEQDLRAIPGMNDLLNRVAAQDANFSQGIPKMIERMAQRNVTTNSSNGYDTITRALQPADDDHPNAIKNQNQLDALLGKSDGTGINKKDYNDAKPATNLDSTAKEKLLKHMQEITNANGNVDGKGQERALQWYNQVMAANKQNETLGDKKNKDFWKTISEDYKPPMPSRMEQISNAAQKPVPVLTDKAQFDALPSGSLYVRNGTQYRKP